MDDTRFSAEIQGRVSQFKGYLLQEGFSRPVARCASEVVLGLVKCRDVRVQGLARGLGERISLKKTRERLRRGLSRVGLWEQLTEAHLKRHAGQIRRMRYCVMDISDVQKPYTTKAEGVGLVRDGSAGARDWVGPGYWWITAVMSDGEELLPVHSELFSVEAEAAEHQSENKKLVGIAERVHQVHPDAIMVMDRGGDRNTILEPLLRAGIPFVVRGMGSRKLRLHADSEKETNVEQIAGKVRLTEQHTLRRVGRHRRGKCTAFDLGIKQVYLGEHPLWLVACRRQGAGRSWYLTNCPGTRHQIMSTVVQAYGQRWRIEELHRHIKQDFHFEQIAVRDYPSIKALGVLVMLAASFVMRLPQALMHAILAVTGVLPRKRLSDIPAYPFYLVCQALAKLLAAAGKRPPTPLWLRRRDYWQLKLNLVPMG